LKSENSVNYTKTLIKPIAIKLLDCNMPEIEEIKRKIKEIEEEILRTQKNKATEHHLGKLKAKLARLREELREAKSKGKPGKGFSVKKEGDASAGIVGFPSVGKSTLFNALVERESKIGDYDFTTLEAIPGMMEFNGARIQIIDFPGLLEGANEGRGRGREVLSALRSMDMLLIMLDVNNPIYQFEVILKELYGAGFRLNRKKPYVKVVKRGDGGIRVFKPQDTKLSEREIRGIASECFVNADIIIRDDLTEEELIDALMGNRVYIPAVVVLNKIDLADEKGVEGIVKAIESKGWKVLPVSAKYKHGIEELRRAIYDNLRLIRVFTKPPKGEVNYSKPIILREGNRIEDVCKRLHKDFIRKFKYARVWGKSVKYQGQKVGLDHILMDGDVIQIVTKK